MIKQLSLTAVLITMLANGATAQVTLSQVRDANTADQLLAMGGRIVAGSEFQQKVVGRTLDDGTWVWFVNPDGTHSARAKDGSWSDSGGRWELRGDQYCRNTANRLQMRCSTIFIIGDYMRMGQQGGELADWTVKIE